MQQVLIRHSQEPTATTTSPVRVARTAGVFYLAVAVLGTFAQVVRVRIYVPGDAATTTANVVANAGLVRLSVMADLIQATLMIFVVISLYRLLAHVNKPVAQVMVIFVSVSVAITCLNLVHQFGAVLVATSPSYITAFGAEGSQAVVLLLLDLQHYGYLIAQVFFGLWLFPLGLLAYRSALFPKPIGVLLMVATAAYLTDVALQFLAPDLASVVSPILIVPVVILAEVSMLGYLLTKGIKTPRPDREEPRAHDVTGDPADESAHQLEATQPTHRR